MRISLKNFLISTCIVGALIGVMTRLFIESPETFLTVVRLGSTVGPFLLAVATIIWIGVRGATRRRGLVVWGCALMLTPVLTYGVLGLLWPSGNPLRVLSTPRLISKRLPIQINEPWVWQELERRLAAGDLTKADVDTAVAELTAYMTRTAPTGWNQPFHWQKRFLTSIVKGRMISEPAHLALCEAFYGTTPVITLTMPGLKEFDTTFPVQIEYGSNWADQTGLDVDLVWDLKQVLLDGKPLNVRNFLRPFDWQASMTLEASLAPGEHELEVQLDCALVNSALVAGADLKSLKPDQCPKAKKRWIATAIIPVKVTPAEMMDVESDE